MAGYLIAVITIITFAIWYEPPKMCNPCWEIPTSWNRVVVPMDAVRISIREHGQFGVYRSFTGYHDRGLSVQEIPEVIRTAAELNPLAPFVLRAETTTPYSMIELVLNALKAGGATMVYFETTQQTINNGA